MQTKELFLRILYGTARCTVSNTLVNRPEDSRIALIERLARRGVALSPPGAPAPGAAPGKVSALVSLHTQKSRYVYN